MRILTGIKLAASCATILIAASPTGLATAAPAVALESGQWQEHRYSFVYMGFTSTYSCDGLADKLKLLLLTAGARADVKARSGACASGFGRPDKFARADLVFYTLAPAAGATPPDSPGFATGGTWRSVTFGSHRPRDLRTGDCELVEQFKTAVLPMFTTRNVQGNTTCIPHQDSGSVIDLRFDVFAAVQHPEGRKN